MKGKIYYDIVKRRYLIKLNVKNTWFYKQILNILKISIFFKLTYTKVSFLFDTWYDKDYDNMTSIQ